MSVLARVIGVAAAAAGVCAATLAQVTIQAGPFVNERNGHTYYRLTGSTDVNAYRGFALSQLGGYLATINNADENSFIDNTVLGNNTAYIGLSDELSEGVFVWDNGQPVEYTRWDSGEPNNDGNEDFASIRPNGRWNDVSNGEVGRAIVEVSGNDTCGFATPMSVDGPFVEVSLIAATVDPSETNLCSSEPGFNVSRAVWCTFTGAGRAVTVTTCGYFAQFDAAIQVLRGSCGDFSCIKANNDSGDCKTSAAVTVFAESGVTYYVLVRSIMAEGGPAVAGVRVFTTVGPSVQLTDRRALFGMPYYRTTQPVLWQDAQAYAQSLGANLVTISSAIMNEWMRGAFVGNFFIGFNDVANEGTFAWASGEPISFDPYWGPGEPNNAARNEDFAVMNPNGAWNDVDGGELRRAVIEFRSNELCWGARMANPPAVRTAPYILRPLAEDESACGEVSGRGLWYQFAGTGGIMVVSTCRPGTTMDTTLRVFSGSCGALSCVASNDNGACGTGSTVEFRAEAGVDYWVCVGKGGGLEPAPGDAIEVSISEGALCPADIDGNGIVNSTDVSVFINIWFADQANGTLNADFNDDGVSNSTDVSDLINAYFAPGPWCR